MGEPALDLFATTTVDVVGARCSMNYDMHAFQKR
jgi:hypothetical protein